MTSRREGCLDEKTKNLSWSNILCEKRVPSNFRKDDVSERSRYFSEKYLMKARRTRLVGLFLSRVSCLTVNLLQNVTDAELSVINKSPD